MTDDVSEMQSLTGPGQLYLGPDRLVWAGTRRFEKGVLTLMLITDRWANPVGAFLSVSGLHGEDNAVIELIQGDSK
jgi:hypothetical protein